MQYQSYKLSVCKISVFILKILKTIYSCQKILFVVDRKLMKLNLDILMPKWFVFKISLMRRLVFKQGSNILHAQIFLHGNMQNMTVIILDSSLCISGPLFLIHPGSLLFLYSKCTHLLWTCNSTFTPLLHIKFHLIEYLSLLQAWMRKNSFSFAHYVTCRL